jgi:hypothetical protein
MRKRETAREKRNMKQKLDFSGNADFLPSLVVYVLPPTAARERERERESELPVLLYLPPNTPLVSTTIARLPFPPPTHPWQSASGLAKQAAKTNVVSSLYHATTCE